MGVNLLVEGAPIKLSRPLFQRPMVICNPPLTVPFTADQASSGKAEMSHQKLSGYKHSSVPTLPCSGKENRAAGEKKRQLRSTSPKREKEVKAEVQDPSCIRRSCRSLASEQPVMVHTEPQRKARRLGLNLSAKRTTLVPRSLSFSLTDPHSISESKCQTGRGQRSHMSRSLPPQTAFEPQHRTSAHVFRSLQCPLPTLEVFSLRPNIVAAPTAWCGPNLSSQPNAHKHHFLLCSQRKNMAKYREECTWRSKKMENKQ